MARSERAGVTKQGVRDLGGNDRRPVRRQQRLLPRHLCAHANADKRGEHFYCEDCGSWTSTNYDYIYDIRYESW